MIVERTISTEADAAHAWAALADVTAYPRWTASMTAVEPLDGPGLDPGARFRIRQPGLPTTIWQVDEVHPGVSFTWVNASPGVRTVAYHHVEPQADGTTRIRIGLRQRGPLAGLLALLVGAKTRRYLRMEAAGLKAAAEAPHR